MYLQNSGGIPCQLDDSKSTIALSKVVPCRVTIANCTPVIGALDLLQRWAPNF